MKKWFDWFCAKCARVTSSGDFVAEVDGLRFIAVVTVFWHHLFFYVSKNGPVPFTESFTNVLLRDSLETFWYGVHLFFAISGLILAMPFASQHLFGERPMNLKRYYLRRLTRLEPPYIVNLLVCFALLVVVKNQSARELLDNLLVSIFYSHSLVYGKMSVINPVIWSLEIEVQFYLLAPFLSLVFCIRPAIFRRAVIFGIGALSAFLDTRGWFSNACLFKYLPYFMVGFMLTDYYLISWKRERRTSHWWDALSFAGWAALIPVLHYKFHMNYLFPLAVLAAYSGAFKGTWFSRMFRARFLVTVGGMCYTIYLYQIPIIVSILMLTRHLVVSGSFALNFLVQSVMIGMVGLVFCSLLFVIFEKPFMLRDWPARAGRMIRQWWAPRLAKPKCDGAADMN